MAAATRTTRELGTRDAEKRDGWKPPSLLPVPLPQAGYKFRWIRIASYGVSDLKNTSSRMREGWVPVKAEDHPELAILSDSSAESKFPGAIEVGGLLLCKTPVENVVARTNFYNQRAADQIETVDHNFLRQNDPRMPLSRPERRTSTTFGGPKPAIETPE